MQESDRTILSPAQQPTDDRTQVVSAPGATLMGASIQCPVCRDRNIQGEMYCSGCGFLLESEPDQQADVIEPPALLRNNRTGHEYILTEGDLSVGRDNADILIADPSVSRQHARLTVASGKLIVTDLGSTNGTIVDGRRLQPQEQADASDASEITFGSVTVTVTLNQEQAVAESAAQTEDAEQDDGEIGASASLEQAEDSISGSACTLAEPPSDDAEQDEPVLAQDAPEGDAVASLHHSETGAVYNIGPDGAALGRRQAGNDIVLDNPYVSSSHASIAVSGGVCTLIDNGSTNGTTVNDQKVQPGEPVQLADGDRVSFGPVALVFRQGT